MSKRWVHPLFKPSKRSARETNLFQKRGPLLSFNPRANEIESFVSFARWMPKVGGFGQLDGEKPTAGVNSRLLIFVVAASLAVLFSVSAIYLKTKFTYFPGITSEHTELRFKPFSPVDKEVFLASLSKESRRQFAGQVNYVSQIMMGQKVSAEEAKKLANLVVLESLRTGYDPLLVAAIMKSESTFNRHAVSYAGAMGLMQIMPATGKFASELSNVEWRGPHRLRDPEYNIRLGIAYLKHLEDEFKGNRELTLIAYNWGPQNVVHALRKEKQIPSSCVRYAKTILNNHGRWNAQFAKSTAAMNVVSKNTAHNPTAEIIS